MRAIVAELTRAIQERSVRSLLFEAVDEPVRLEPLQDDLMTVEMLAVGTASARPDVQVTAEKQALVVALILEDRAEV